MSDVRNVRLSMVEGRQYQRVCRKCLKLHYTYSKASGALCGACLDEARDRKGKRKVKQDD